MLSKITSWGILLYAGFRGRLNNEVKIYFATDFSKETKTTRWRLDRASQKISFFYSSTN